MKKTLYEIITELPQHSAYLKMDKKCIGTTAQLIFNLKDRIIKCGNAEIFNKGLLQETLLLSDGTVYDLKDIDLIHVEECDQYEKIEELYTIYQKSIPNKSSNDRKSNFRAMPVNKFSYKEMMEGIPRTNARYELEGYVLLASFCGAIRWKWPDKFYWQSENNKSLVLFREWIEGEKNENSKRNN